MKVYKKKKYKFMTTSILDGSPGYHERKGSPILVLYKLDEPDEVEGKIYKVMFDDGVTTTAFEDEVVRADS